MCIRLKRYNDIIICHFPLKARKCLSQRDKRGDMEQKGSNTHSPPFEIENNLVKIVWTFPSDALNGEITHGS